MSTCVFDFAPWASEKHLKSDTSRGGLKSAPFPFLPSPPFPFWFFFSENSTRCTKLSEQTCSLTALPSTRCLAPWMQHGYTSLDRSFPPRSGTRIHVTRVPACSNITRVKFS